MQAQMMPPSDLVDDFSFDCAEALSSPIPADQIFHNGKIKPSYDQFQQALLLGSNEISDNTTTLTAEMGKNKALRRLFTEERQRHDQYSSESVSLASESTVSLSETYCVWEPKTVKGNSKRWRFRDLLSRNVCDKDSSQSQSQIQSRSGGSISKNLRKINNDDNDDDDVKKETAQAVRKTFTKGGGGGRRSSYLPYRQELVGIFGTTTSSKSFRKD